MKSLKLTLSLITGMFIAGFTNAQFSNIESETNREELFRLADIWQKERKEQLRKGIEIINRQGREIRYVSPSGTVAELQRLNEFGGIVYYTTDNRDAARTLSTDKVWPGGGLGYSLSGTSMKVGEWDGGRVRISHQELVGRVNLMDSTSSIIDHATHVAGTMIGTGVDTSAKGMAYTAVLDAYDWSFDDSEMATAAANGLLLSNHSYGNITGWRYNSANTEWEWWGDTTLSGSQDYRFGYYDSQTQAWDLISRNAPYYLIVKSAGNDRGETGSGTHYLPLHSTYSTLSRPADGGTSGYDCISTYSGAKNILTIGAVNAIPGGYSSPSSVVMSSFSGWGPTDDGRIKPDLVANGVGVYSCLGSGNTSYASWNGTSMASPNATGSLLLLQQLYFSQNSAYMKSATLKALAIHTADEAGTATGPDYIYGWGLMNTASAANHIMDSTGNKDITETSISNGNNYSFSITASGSSPIRATICWTDVPGTPVTAANNPTTAMLVNDLDIRLMRNSDSTFYYPYVLNPASPASAATSGDNFRDNVEQLFLASPSAGTYTVIVSHKGTLSGGSSQDFSLILDGGNVPALPFSCALVLDSFPELETFDGFTNCSSTSSAMCPLPSGTGWVNDTGDNIDWKVYSGATPTTTTGPDVDFSLGTSAGKYLYVESSTSGTGFPGKKAVLYSPCYSITNLNNPELAFAYHMYGISMGSLAVEVFNGYTWTQIWYESGDQGNNWFTASVDISSINSDTVKFRFTGITGNNFYSDMAIDAIEVREKIMCPDPVNVLVSNIQDSSAVFSWTSNASYWRLRFHLANGMELLKGTINFNPVLISGLMPNTWYDFYIQDSCGGGDTSNWIGPLRFKTTGPLSNPSDCGLELAIPDNNCPSAVVFPIEVSVNGNQMGTNVYLKEVRLIIEHTWNEDLRFGLVSPSGDSVLLSEFNGSSGDNYGDPTDTNCNSVTTFSVSATTPISLGSSPFIGTYQPEDSLSVFNDGSDPNGLWFFYACDDVGSDVGYLQYLELLFDTIINCTDPTVVIGNSGSNSFCVGNSVILSTTGGTFYQWYRNGTLLTGEVDDSLQVTASGNYNVMVTVSGGCSDSSAAGRIITVNSLPVVNITNGGSSTFCQGNSTTLSVPVGSSYQWYKDGQSIPSATSSSYLVTTTGKFNVVVTNSNSCSDSSLTGTSIIVKNKPVVSINSSVTPTFCSGNSTVLSTITGNSFQWFSGGTIIPSAVSSTYSAVISGNYNVMVTAANGCSDSAASALIVTVHPLPNVVITAGGDTVFCDGDSVELTVGPGYNSHQWYESGNAIPGALNMSYVVRNSGKYNVTVSDINNCSDSSASSKRIVVYALPFVAITASATEICDGDSAILTSSAANSYQWRKNGIPISLANTQTLVVKEAGWYNVIAINSNFCSDTASSGIKMIVFDLPVVTLENQPDFCNTQTSTLLSGGLPAGGVYTGNSITGVSGQYFFDPSAAGPGTYNITYTYMDSNFCSNSDIKPVLVKNCTGISLEKKGGEFVLYPNPTSGKINMVVPENSFGRFSLRLFDAKGQLVQLREFEFTDSNMNLELDLSGLTNGVYFVHLQNGGKVWKEKVILDKNL